MNYEPMKIVFGKTYKRVYFYISISLSFSLGSAYLPPTTNFLQFHLKSPTPITTGSTQTQNESMTIW